MPCQSISSLLYIYVYVNTRVTWLITLGRGELAMGNWRQVTESSYKEGEDWFEPALNIHRPFAPPPHVHQNFLFALLQPSSQTNVLGRKILEGGLCLLLPPSCAYVREIRFLLCQVFRTASLAYLRQHCNIICSINIKSQYSLSIKIT